MRIALIGKSGSGKSSAAKLISDDLNLPHIKTGMISRQIARLVFDDESKDNTQLIDNALTTIDKSIFLKATLRRQPNWESGCIIDSLRFHSDYIFAKSKSFIFIRLTCPRSIRHARLTARNQKFSPQFEKHQSETALAEVDVDYEIDNSGDKIELAKNIRAIFIKLNAN